MDITYTNHKDVSVKDVIRVFRTSGIVRPIDQPERIQMMISNSDILLSAWHGNKMIGIARALTDWSFCCYLSDLAVDQTFQKSGVGRNLISMVQEEIGEGVALILLAAPSAITYYPKIGFDLINNGFMIKRKK
ncbi:GNAT family N-acetyltransferase [Paenibacillus polymyxa]|uniref:GNAT family N-acetyltransferase n=1 Tax=Paenibacillus TaxID=44249 RepID=UPI0020B7875D|nr:MULTISPECIES: GNAT family N-acetyltransferase [Paenibacillus]MCP3781468.1 GNAT family N-acetyltransferase [Paenibacillus sp. MZ03-122A]MDY7991009.1 GNAT family N-acetyltransferase [Paenibacillus polymyxa]MDY8120112.1 GNAT family N-acetyltransferase [Paenibacillus polymyxa]